MSATYLSVVPTATQNTSGGLANLHVIQNQSTSDTYIALNALDPTPHVDVPEMASWLLGFTVQSRTTAQLQIIYASTAYAPQTIAYFNNSGLAVAGNISTGTLSVASAGGGLGIVTSLSATGGTGLFYGNVLLSAGANMFFSADTTHNVLTFNASSGGGGTIGGNGSSGQVAFWTNASTLAGNNNFFWDNVNSRVGIRTVSPGYSLHLVAPGGGGDGVTLQTQSTGANVVNFLGTGPTILAQIAYDQVASQFKFYTATAAPILFLTSGNERVRIDSAGNVGIGTAGPAGMVHALASGAAVIPIVAQGVSGQTANLQEWRNSSGTALASISSAGKFVGPALPNNLFTPANTPSTGITNAYKMAGLAMYFTPSKSGNILFLIVFQAVLNGTVPANFFMQPYYGTGTAPVFGATPVGTTFGSFYTNNIPSSNLGVAAAFFAVLSGLTIGTQYWFDVAIRSDNAGSSPWMASINVSIVEL